MSQLRGTDTYDDPLLGTARLTSHRSQRLSGEPASGKDNKLEMTGEHFFFLQLHCRLSCHLPHPPKKKKKKKKRKKKKKVGMGVGEG